MENQRGSNGGLSERLRTDGRQEIDSRKRVAADRIEEIAHALARASEQLAGQPTLAGYANRFAGAVGTLATRVRDGSVEELVDDTRELARRNPGLFILGGVATGVVLARFLKASRRELSDELYSARLATDEPSTSDYSSRPYARPLESREPPHTPGL